MDSPLWKRGVRGDFIEIFNSIGVKVISVFPLPAFGREKIPKGGEILPPFRQAGTLATEGNRGGLDGLF